jgi:hypothetical protein
MGFPCAIVQDLNYEGGAPNVVSRNRLEGFSLTVDGKVVTAKESPDFARLPGLPAREEVTDGEMAGAIVTSWQEVSLAFGEGVSRKVEVKYRNPYYHSEMSISDDSRNSPHSFAYLFSAAGLWKGPIKEGEVIIKAVEIPAGEVKLSHPKRFKREANQWTWQFKDLEPVFSDDLNIVVKQAECRYPVRTKEGGPSGFYVGTGAREDLKSMQEHGRWALHSRDFLVKASSTLAAPAPVPGKNPDDAITYEADNLKDWNKAWSEGVEGDGIGESLVLELPKSRSVSGLEIMNGYQKSENGRTLDLYTANNRVRDVLVQLDDGTPFPSTLKDEQGSQVLTFPGGPKEAGRIKLTIQSVYAGKKFDDTCLSGIYVVIPLSKAPHIQGAR